MTFDNKTTEVVGEVLRATVQGVECQIILVKHDYIRGTASFKFVVKKPGGR